MKYQERDIASLSFFVRAVEKTAKLWYNESFSGERRCHMDVPAEQARIAAHCSRYGALQVTDLFKFLHHSTFGCAHLVGDVTAAEEWLQREMDTCSSCCQTVEMLSGGFCRVHLPHLRALGVSARSFARLFALSAEKTAGSTEELEARLSLALDMAQQGQLPFSREELAAAADAWRQAGYPAQHHSAAFRAAYAPAYRVLHSSHAALLPLLAAIDTHLAAQKRMILAIEGGAGSGKSTLAALLQRIYGCTVLHMDNFFLRPEQRTPERYATPGGNIDHERFAREVLPALAQGETFRYRPFDCATFTVTEGYDVTPTALTVVEGSYSMHPALGQYYDCAVWVDIDPKRQRARIEARNSPAFAARFFTEWIPLEQAYFAAADPAGRCHIRLEVSL